MITDDDGREYLELDDCARRMGITPAQVMELVSTHHLRAWAFVPGEPPWVEPAIVV